MNKQALIAKVNKMPKPANTTAISQAEFDAILTNPELTVVEKHFHNHLETNQVLFVIKDNEIDFVAIKEITANGTRIFKEV
ncbi:cef modifier of supressor tRNAs [Acinetobacter phage vB_AbaM_Konradin]|uniref:Cef protein n=10 Tax=Lazarusvirus TaxID=2842820 RepID=A0A650EVL5_9CAUD|nr:cef modifier of supressor tRNAs [Acinetobacter phage vB_ApiM_fHyAci03]YP_009881431.1 cef modifier of supressor tRNAs [Acinetobacter phage KARL-1]YP_009885199.1 cef modifier of supressor tRNAs [Acinetobacter phage vB_AbaM_Konradin]YP_009886042.1 cef modifier of supressor tRNAs [Acinetobacter phage vB_AbaM_Berthold]YP_009886292.1 cef modifier of supressor tRNAs [Acinetobacter phage vB_AbaM_Apostate]YP_009886536.1 cef modifier of supressor tRNAs [Acinetobacter phage vB_AbaM_Kimel]YP_009886789